MARGSYRRVLTGEVEADGVHLTLGQQGRTLRPEEHPEETDGDDLQGDESKKQ